MDELEWECYWLEIVAYSEEVGISTSYCEDEFILDGNLIQVYPEGTSKPPSL
jgi:hypothetical protein